MEEEYYKLMEDYNELKRRAFNIVGLLRKERNESKRTIKALQKKLNKTEKSLQTTQNELVHVKNYLILKKQDDEEDRDWEYVSYAAYRDHNPTDTAIAYWKRLAFLYLDYQGKLYRKKNIVNKLSTSSPMAR